MTKLLKWLFILPRKPLKSVLKKKKTNYTIIIAIKMNTYIGTNSKKII